MIYKKVSTSLPYFCSFLFPEVLFFFQLCGPSGIFLSPLLSWIAACPPITLLEPHQPGLTTENWLVILIVQMFLIVCFSQRNCLWLTGLYQCGQNFLLLPQIPPPMESTCPSWLSVLILHQPPTGRQWAHQFLGKAVRFSQFSMWNFTPWFEVSMPLNWHPSILETFLRTY